MAIAIKNIPVLTDKVARDFVANAEAASKRKGSVDFSAQAKAAKKILAKANF